MDKQTKEARQMAKDLPAKERMAHIWMYYKWWIIGVVVGSLLIGGTIYEMATRPTYDLEIGYYSEKYIADEAIEALEEYLTQFVDDVDGNGVKTVKIYATSTSMMGDSGEGMVAIQSKFMAELSSGAYPVFFFDDVFYETMQQESYADTMESYRDMSEIPELKENLQIPEDSHVYWATRALYQSESKKEKQVAKYGQAQKTEAAIFGERP